MAFHKEQDRNFDWRALLVKYVAHVGAAEGEYFAHNLEQMAPCTLPGMELTEQDKEAFKEVVGEVLAWFGSLTTNVHEEMRK